MPITAASIARLKRGHQHLLAETNRAFSDSLKFAGRHAEDFVQRYPQFKPRSPGGLQSATKTKVVRTKGGKLLRITNNKPYAAAIDGGAKAHVISAKGGGYLRFKGKNGWARVRSVQHPGNKPYKFLYRAHRSASRVLDRNLTQRLSKIASRF